MTNKNWPLEVGERGRSGEDGDVLLSSKVSERKRKEIQRQEEVDEAEHKAKMAKLKKETKSAAAETEKVEKKSEQSESGVKVLGEVNMGKVDLQEQSREAQEELKKMRRDAEESARAQGQVSDELREKVHDKEMEVLKVTFQAQMDMLTKTLESKGSQKSLLEQLADLRETAKEIGLAEPQSAGDLTVQVELKKIELEHQLTLRKMMREDKASDRDFQLKLRELDDKRERDKQELLMQQKNQDFWKGAPAAIGQAMYEGIKASQPSDITEEAPQETKRRGKGHHIEIGKGEGGVLPCPDCGAEIQVGPTARQGVCANCGLSIPVKRVAAEVEESESGLRPTY